MKGAIAIGTVFVFGALASAAAADEAKAPPPKAGGPSAGAPATPHAAVVAPMPPKQQPPPEPEMKPAPEIADAAKAMVGSYKCKGVDFNPDGSSRPSLSTMKISSELDGFYILVDLQEQKTKENATPFKARMYRTYDADAKKWTNTMLATAPGGPLTMTTTDTMGGQVTWSGSFSMQGHAFTEKSHEEPDAKTKSVHIWGEFSMDGGKTFNKDYDITCKK